MNSKFFSKKHHIKPFVDPSSLEFLLERNNSALFMLINNSKKRPNNCIMGRTFDNSMLDFFEMQITDYKSLKEFKADLKITPGARPVVMF
jgi:ribosome production factor 2